MKELINKLFKKSVKMLLSLIGILIGYALLSWIFLGIYDARGFERTLIILLIGVFYYGVRGIVFYGRK